MCLCVSLSLSIICCQFSKSFSIVENHLSPLFSDVLIVLLPMLLFLLRLRMTLYYLFFFQNKTTRLFIFFRSFPHAIQYICLTATLHRLHQSNFLIDHRCRWVEAKGREVSAISSHNYSIAFHKEDTYKCVVINRLNEPKRMTAKQREAKKKKKHKQTKESTTKNKWLPRIFHSTKPNEMCIIYKRDSNSKKTS